MAAKKTVLGVTLARLLGLVIFLLLLWVMNIIHFDNSVYISVVNFLNNNLGYIIIYSILFYIGELFSIMRFPLNMPAPVFNAFGGIFLVIFIFQIFYALGDSLQEPAFSTFRLLEPFAVGLVFLLALIVGYVRIISMELYPDRKRHRTRHHETPGKKKARSDDGDVSWDDVGSEFRKAFYNMASSMKERFSPKPTKGKKE